MIIGSWERLEINKIYGQESSEYITRKNLEINKIERYYKKPFLVLREATYDEWLNQQIERESNYIDKNPLHGSKGYYYEISVD